VLRATAVMAAALAAAISASADDEVVVFRHTFATGEVWRERVSVGIQILDGAGGVVSSDETTVVERVEVQGVSPQGSALLRRSDASVSGGKHTVVSISDRGEYTSAPAVGDVAPERGAAEYAALWAMRAPVLPDGPVAPGRPRTRQLIVSWPGTTLAVVETATLVSVEFVDGRRVARIELVRSCPPAAGVVTVDALAAPAAGASAAVPAGARAVVDLGGIGGRGEIVFDVAAGRMLAYRMEETVGLTSSVGRTTITRTARITVSIARLADNAP
jgi:hypothetical protein